MKVRGSDIVKSIIKDLNEMEAYKRTGQATLITVFAKFGLRDSLEKVERRHVLVEKDFTVGTVHSSRG